MHSLSSTVIRSAIGPIVGLGLVFSLPASAQPPAGDFETHKRERLAHIDENIKEMNNHRACIAAAASHESMKACRVAMKDQRTEQKVERLEKRKANIERRMENLKDRRQPSEAGE